MAFFSCSKCNSSDIFLSEYQYELPQKHCPQSAGLVGNHFNGYSPYFLMKVDCLFAKAVHLKYPFI